MRFSLSALAVLATSLLPLTDACLIMSGRLAQAQNNLVIRLNDNGREVCSWYVPFPTPRPIPGLRLTPPKSGRITVNKEQCMNCQSGFFSWVRFTNTGVNGNVAKGEVAYAYGGQNFKFGFQAGGQGCDPYGCQWYGLYSANYGCFAVMSLSYPTRAASGLSITEGEGEETAGAALVPSVVFDGSPSWTASGVAIKTAAAVPKVAPRVRRAADLEFV